jgi:hypothetical protein
MDNTYTWSPDRDRINIHEYYEVEYWVKELGVNSEELKKAVASVGTSSEAIRKHFNK